MALFRRRRRSDVEEMEPVEELDGPELAEAVAAPARPDGPWDAADEPDDGAQRVDLGALRVPVPAETEVRVEVNPQGQVVAATLVRGESALQLNAFAAPRTEGIWAEVREEIATAVSEGGGRAQEVDGPFGPELRALVPTDVPGQGQSLAPARFLGVDGPRWFVRALLTGPAAADGSAAAELESALRAVVVVRGSDPMAVRDPLPLRLPPDVVAEPRPEGDVDAEISAADRRQAPGLPVRGPEITELR